jgi:phosphatidylglycerophosphatase A
VITSPLNPPLAPPVLRPSLRFMLAHPAHVIALGFGSGLSPLAPGTAGTVFGWASFLLLDRWLSDTGIAFVIVVSLAIGWWACTTTAHHMRVLDPGSIVWDEVVSFWIVLWLFMPTDFWGQLGAFALFRLLDAVKPGPVGWADGLFHGFGWRAGFGIFFDDLMAAFCTLLLLAAWRLW